MGLLDTFGGILGGPVGSALAGSLGQLRATQQQTAEMLRQMNADLAQANFLIRNRGDLSGLAGEPGAMIPVPGPNAVEWMNLSHLINPLYEPQPRDFLAEARSEVEALCPEGILPTVAPAPWWHRAWVRLLRWLLRILP